MLSTLVLSVAAANLIERLQHIAQLEASTLKLTWSDCGTGDMGKVNSLTPEMLTLGKSTTVSGKGTLSEAVTGGTYDIVMKAGFITEHWNGDICDSKKFGFPLGLGSLTFNGMACPVQAGATTLSMDLYMSSMLSAPFTTSTLAIRAKDTSGAQILCLNVKTAPENMALERRHDGRHGHRGRTTTSVPPSLATDRIAKPQRSAMLEASTLKLTWDACGSSDLGTVSSVTPNMLTLGQHTTVTGSGTLSEAVTGGTYDIVMKAGFITEHWTGDICDSKKFGFPLGLGSLTFNALKCPIAAGKVDLTMDLYMSSMLSAPFTTSHLSIRAKNTAGEQMLCVNVNTAPENSVDEELKAFF